VFIHYLYVDCISYVYFIEKDDVCTNYTLPTVNATLVSMEYHMTPSSVFLNCITSGLLPTTVLWSKDCAMLSQNITTQRLTNPATALYSNILSWDTSGGENLRGMYSCNVYMDWVTADNSRSGRERK